MDGRRAPPRPDRFGQRLQHEARHGGAQTRHDRIGHRIARLPFLAFGRTTAGLDGMKTGFAVHAEIVLGVADANHDVADAQRRIESACHAAHQERAAVKSIQQQRRRDAGIDFAGARLDENRFAAGDLAAPEREASDFPHLAGTVAQMGEFLGQGRYDAEEPFCHAGMRYKVGAINATDSVTPPSRETLRRACTEFAEEAAREIMRIYAGDLGVRNKADKSPVTDADHAAEAIIVKGLRVLTPDTPVVAEEEMAAGRVPALKNGGPFWLVDPLDGTKEFIKRNGEFTVNIALVENGRPMLGIVLAPASGTLWRGIVGEGADKREGAGPFTPIHTRPAPANGLTACASRSHAIYSDLDIWFRSNNLAVADRVQAGSSLKFCLIAEGKADIYPRFGPTNEWDTAAGHAVLEAAGGEVVTTDGRPLGYGKPGFGNPHFIARSKDAR